MIIFGKFLTGVRFFDKKGGLKFGEIYEFVGGPGSYKTALCHQIAVKFVQSTQGKVIYIDTDGTFQPERLLRISKAFSINEKLLDNIFVSRHYEFSELINELKMIPKKVDKPFLLIIDSIITPFASIPRDRRIESLFLLAKHLRRIAYLGNAVVITNQIRAYRQSEFISELEKQIRLPTTIWEKLGVLPALHPLIDTFIDTRIFLQKTSRKMIIGRIIFSRSLKEEIFGIRVIGDILI